MYVQHFDPQKLVSAYGVDLQLLYPWEGVVEPPFGAAWAILGAGNSTKLHQHQEGETFFITRGEGVMTIGGDRVEVRAGSVVFQRPFQQHTLTNTSATEDLVLLTIWWEDRKLWARDARTDTADTDAAQNVTTPVARRVMVTAAPPTPNGDLHLGHLAGPYLSADFYTRYLRLRGRPGFYACGTDDHCMYVERVGQKLGLGGEQAAAHFTAQIEASLAEAGIAMDLFLHPDRSEHFAPLVHELFDRLWTSGKLEAREGPSPFCERCARYLFEADVTGGCPACGTSVTGNTCEACGQVNDCHNLVAPRCTACGEPAGERVYRRLFFPLGRYAEMLTTYHRKTAMNPHLRAFCERALASGLPDVAISHPSTWGLPVPLDDAALSGQKLYVWFEMAARYFAYAQHLAEAQGEDGGYRRFWCADDAEIAQFFGFDNSFYYALLLPALTHAFDPELRLPTAFVTNELYQLEGLKFSTSRGHAIWARELLAEAPRDAVRFYLAHTCPEREQTNFTRAEFNRTIDTELVVGWQGWLHELAAKVRNESAGKVPSTGDWTSEHRAFYHLLERFLDDAAEAYEPATFSPQRLTRVLCELVRSARRRRKS
ncbi:MAG: class I tRNA ligase family protein [Thermoanaerobaculia bacterium]|nr:class I tRNA ligase family protein [Thermoanaerobaculia bacterium]